MDNNWRKSSRSNSTGECVEAGQAPGTVLVRDTKDRGIGPVLRVNSNGWERLIASLRR